MSPNYPEWSSVIYLMAGSCLSLENHPPQFMNFHLVSVLAIKMEKSHCDVSQRQQREFSITLNPTKYMVGKGKDSGAYKSL